MKLKQEIRLKFRESVFERDGYKCVFCDETEDLDAHHITDRSLMPNGGYVKENGITVCPLHHMEVEQFWISDGELWFEDMHPNDLYKLINSSYTLAVEKSEKLSCYTK